MMGGGSTCRPRRQGTVSYLSLVPHTSSSRYISFSPPIYINITSVLHLPLHISLLLLCLLLYPLYSYASSLIDLPTVASVTILQSRYIRPSFSYLHQYHTHSPSILTYLLPPYSYISPSYTLSAVASMMIICVTQNSVTQCWSMVCSFG
jgi:hypothetical protein